MKRSIYLICLIAIVLCLLYLAYGFWREYRIPEAASPSPTITTLTLPDAPMGTYQTEFVDTTYEGYPIIAQLTIPAIDLNIPVLATYSEETLAISATKFYGPAPNEIGNFCIAGHNYPKPNMFNHLIDLSIGDTIYLTDNENGRGTYRIYDLYKVVPTDISPLSQETNGATEITLITCTNYSSKRFIVKAVKI